MSRLMIIGIDSLEFEVISNHIDKLPNFKRLIQKSITKTSKSIFPVDTIPAWATIYTGRHPGNHGLLYSYDVFDPKLDDLRKLELKRLEGRCFWDHVSNEGYRVGIVNPVLAYPPWHVNGFMTSKSPFDVRINKIETAIPFETCPQSMIKKYNFADSLNSVWGGHPGKSNLIEWSDKAMASLKAEADIGLKLCEGEAWDLFYIYVSQLDIVQHRLWRFFDPNDPTYPGKTPFSPIIPNFYKYLDKMIGQFRQIDEGSDLIILSDHGHKIRPYKTININKMLTDMGLQKKKGMKQKYIQKMKRIILQTSNKLELETSILNIVVMNSRLTSISKSMYSPPTDVSTSKNKAYLSSFAGIKSYPHGGVQINKESMSEDEYANVVQDIITRLGNMVLEDGRPMFQWIMRRQDYYPGTYTETIFPDILFELQDDHGVGWENDGKKYGSAYDHNVASGGHSRRAVLLVDSNRTVKKDGINLMDIAPSVLDIMEIDWKGNNFDGMSIFEG